MISFIRQFSCKADAWLESTRRCCPTLAFSCGARSAFKLKEKGLLEKHAIAPSAARLCSAAVPRNLFIDHRRLSFIYLGFYLAKHLLRIRAHVSSGIVSWRHG